jgi:prostaglandin-H2 D-isomerase / glutathione transferase
MSESESELTLIYFNARGLAETSRILLALAQVDYTDHRYPLEIVDPVKHVYVRDEFDNDKKAGMFNKSMGRLPILRITENFVTTEIPQSKAIERFISKRYGLMGSSLLEEAKIDAVCECIRDIKDRYQKVRSGTDEEKTTYFSQTIYTEFEDLAKVLDSSSRCAVGNKLSLADVSIYCLVTQFYDNKEIVRNVAANIPKIRDIVIRVAARPEIRVYLQDRPVTAF